MKKNKQSVSAQKKPVAVVVFPGTQCDRDTIKALQLLNYPVKTLFSQERFYPKNYAGFVLPGGFSYGDYLRAGALAGHSPAMQDLKTAAKQGRPILGICNGFQILCEAGLLEGVLQINYKERFIDEWVDIELHHTSPTWGGVKKTSRLPIAHKQGAFYATKDQLKKLQDREQIWWKYKGENPNGSLNNIAGIMNESKNVAGLMPHPERAMAHWMGSADGIAFLKNF